MNLCTKQCPCGQEITFDGGKLSDHVNEEFRCPGCNKTIALRVKSLPDDYEEHDEIYYALEVVT